MRDGRHIIVKGDSIPDEYVREAVDLVHGILTNLRTRLDRAADGAHAIPEGAALDAAPAESGGLAEADGEYYYVTEGDNLNYPRLVGPHGFECVLTEPEDRIWTRDLAPVVKLLNEQFRTINGWKKEARTYAQNAGFWEERAAAPAAPGPAQAREDIRQHIETVGMYFGMYSPRESWSQLHKDDWGIALMAVRELQAWAVAAPAPAPAADALVSDGDRETDNGHERIMTKVERTVSGITFEVRLPGYRDAVAEYEFISRDVAVAMRNTAEAAIAATRAALKEARE